MVEFDQLENSTEQVEQKTYDGDDYLENYLNDLDRPKQEFEPPIIPEDEPEIEELETEIERERPQYSRDQLNASNSTAFFIVQKADQLLSAGVAAYAHANDPQEFTATSNEIKEISDHLGIYFAENAFELPPWVMAAIPGFMVLQKKFSLAGNLRKANIERKKTEDENAELKRQISKLENQKTALELKSKIKNLETQINQGE